MTNSLAQFLRECTWAWPVLCPTAGRRAAAGRSPGRVPFKGEGKYAQFESLPSPVISPCAGCLHVPALGFSRSWDVRLPLRGHCDLGASGAAAFRHRRASVSSPSIRLSLWALPDSRPRCCVLSGHGSFSRGYDDQVIRGARVPAPGPSLLSGRHGSPASAEHRACSELRSLPVRILYL